MLQKETRRMKKSENPRGEWNESRRRWAANCRRREEKKKKKKKGGGEGVKMKINGK